MSEERSEQFRKLMDLLSKQEDLHPDLVPYLNRDGPLGVPSLQHPLVYSIFHTPTENARANASYAAKKKEVEKAEKEGNWTRYIFMHERPYRFDALVAAAERGLKIDPEKYWSMVGNVWTDSENIWQNRVNWQKLWTEPVPRREIVMDEDEAATLASLPDEFRVWRGVGHKVAARGMSWTIDKDRAIWFARRFAGHNGRAPHVVTGMVKKKDVLAYFDGRNEKEIVALPKNVSNQKWLDV